MQFAKKSWSQNVGCKRKLEYKAGGVDYGSSIQEKSPLNASFLEIMHHYFFLRYA